MSNFILRLGFLKLNDGNFHLCVNSDVGFETLQEISAAERQKFQFCINSDVGI
jgi:hypothetical protein